MLINADKPTLWKADVVASIDLYNSWFINFAPSAYRETRTQTAQKVRQDLALAAQLTRLTSEVLLDSPAILPTLRMATAPPLARDRLIGLAQVPPSLVDVLERGKLPRRMEQDVLLSALTRICEVISKLLDEDLFPWVTEERLPSDVEQERAAAVVADRLSGAFLILSSEMHKKPAN